jgi:predicted flap endonuclease-1-like 5' DNA nuclease
MSRKLVEIEGIGDVTAAKMGKAGVVTVEDLLEKGKDEKGRKAIADASGMMESKVLHYVGMADLVRVNGIGGEFAELLKLSDVDTVRELGQRNAANLHKTLTETNAQKEVTRRVPSEEQLQKFIEEAKGMDTMVTH